MPPIRLPAPHANGGILDVPPFAEVLTAVARNRQILDNCLIAIDGIPLSELRQFARREAIDLACAYLHERGEEIPASARAFSPHPPLVLAGHQPELVHPGVWAKNFALNGLAQRVDGVPLNLIVDNDTLKSASIRIPVCASPLTVRLQSIPFDEFNRQIPYEDYRAGDEECFRSFAARIAEFQAGWGFEPLVYSVWNHPEVGAGLTVGERFAAMRRRQEREWGCVNLELPVSLLSGTAAFTHFARHLLADGQRFRAIYNAALRTYRKANGIRGDRHPAPDLAEGELPFWVREDARSARIRATAASNPEHLRPRALSLTLFARLCLGDFFIHGIGGGKYDEVADAIARDYFGIEPPAYQVLSATLHLPLPGYPARPSDLAFAQHLLRDLNWNPQRHLPDASNPLVQARADLIATEPDRTQSNARRAWFKSLKHNTESLRAFTQDRSREVQGICDRYERELAANAILQRRDYAWVLYPSAILKPFLRQFLRSYD